MCLIDKVNGKYNCTSLRNHTIVKYTSATRYKLADNFSSFEMPIGLQSLLRDNEGKPSFSIGIINYIVQLEKHLQNSEY